jgi:hypothetical protein
MLTPIVRESVRLVRVDVETGLAQVLKAAVLREGAEDRDFAALGRAVFQGYVEDMALGIDGTVTQFVKNGLPRRW